MPDSCWERILDFPAYRVSEGGEIYNDRIRKPMKTYVTSRGYEAVILHNENGYKHFLVHRLVAMAFIENPHGLPYINHKDENKRNNNADNLEWCDQKYNANYGTAQKRRVENTDFSKPIYKITMRNNQRKQIRPVIQYTDDGMTIAEYDSIKEAVQATGFNSGSISECCKHLRRKHVGGYCWRYKER